MKKLLSLFAVAVLAVSTTFAQTTVAVPVSKQTAQKVATAKTVAPAAKVQVKKAETKVVAAPTAAKKEVKNAATAANTKAVKLKADGTPDMRYAENKAKKAVAGPTKKDGTADMRYKANKAAAAKKN